MPLIGIVKIENEKLMNFTESYVLIYRFRFVTFDGLLECELEDSWFNGVNENVNTAN